MPVPSVSTRGLGNMPGKGSVSLRTTIHRANRSPTLQTRTLWWWSRHSGESSSDENLEERLRRHEKIMRSRYSKSLRRKALWEREDSPLWPWRPSGRYWRTRYCDYKPSSSETDPKEEAGQDERAGYTGLGNSVRQDFESFKAAVDRAIAEDPYSALFGRRFRNRPSSDDDHGSWTSLWASSSNVQGADNGQGSTKPELPQQSQPLSTYVHDSRDTTKTAGRSENIQTAPPAHTTSFAANTDTRPVDSLSAEDYEFDPISMRKVPVKKPDVVREAREPVESPQTTKPKAVGETKKPFLESLFSEHGVDIPVKTYKPHKVYGYRAPAKTAEKTEEKTTPTASARRFDSSTRREFRDFMARVMGNSIDTTAQFTESNLQQTADEDVKKDVPTKKTREFPEFDATTPLFSGTTYEGRSKDSKVTEPGKQNWLVKEGFRSHNDDADNSQSMNDGDIPVKKYAGFQAVTDAYQSPRRRDHISQGISLKTSADRLEPALDRIQAKPSTESADAPFRLETSLDRRSNTKNSAAEQEQHPQEAKVFTSPISTTEEDLDLLRASDVRAATRSARLTKQEKDSMKKDAREKLEADFVARENEKTELTAASTPSASSKLTQGLNTVWDHVREYPNGIVAKTMKSMEAFNSNYKKYLRPNKGLTEKLVFKDESLSKVASIYKTKAPTSRSRPFTPSPEVVKAEEQRELRIAALKEATDMAKKQSAKTNAQLSKLSQDIQMVYESEYGPIEVNHRQSVKGDAATETTSASPAPTHAPSNKPHPLLSASVKPGVKTNQVIDKHVSEFEPKIAELVDNAKQIRKAILESHIELGAIRARYQASSTSLGAVLDGTKEVRRELHEVKQAIRAIESGRPETVWNAPNAACSNFGKKRIDLRAEDSSVVPTRTAEASNKGIVNERGGGETSIREAVKEGAEKSVPEPVFTPDGSPEWNDEQPPSIESLRTKKFDSAYVILAYDSAAGKVEISPMNEPTKQSSKSADAVGILSRLNHAPEFLKHFATLKRAGYSLFNGSEDMLIFKKKQPEPLPGLRSATSTANAVISPATPQPNTDITHKEQDNETATVLNQIPAKVEPVEEPAAATAPRSRPSTTYDNLPKVRRQESVFSGTLRPSAASSSGGDNDGYSHARSEASGPAGTENSVWNRITRGVRQTVLTIAALCGGAYAIGFIAEGMGAQAQKQNGIDDAQVSGPRKRIVMTGQRPGIFSTESSR
ncbi:hypothetical protein LTR10_019814 [Elasticomyces elasticus]|uniref:Uncharacterized protein n=1 Tax=Exophiala sideris TaxID=1016849 RepID=A0ABR0J171_9EURO|nr:hypothetical protein LTR10_019814 [Elasticomyces elasticus]KAK5024398.1 hypothetical protein LTS07_008689 [Exophiala sideris]KAK5030920.1 hypothetical protein LTR13_007933 [Exophiala sideris]KAK5054131.1 hypothetical protein LTR69_009093 [Exophiala sideris]KAK5179513.1 hypothetical protein LTR44_008029 [Eurotiomycetes sp. CCFEE 6388]